MGIHEYYMGEVATPVIDGGEGTATMTVTFHIGPR